MRQIIPLLLLGSALLGCAAPNKKLVQIQQDKEQLLAAIRDQRDKNRALEGQVASLETRLGQAEKELARAGGGTRISSRPAPMLPPAKSEPLPWRQPASGGSSKKSGIDPSNSKTSGPVLRSASGAIAALAARDSRLVLDRSTGQAQLAAPVAFDEQTGALTAESKRQLDQVSKLLRSEEARDLQVTVSAAGGRPRAQAVADYLDSHGIPQGRLTVADPPSIAPTALRGNPSSDVRITLSGDDQPLRR